MKQEMWLLGHLTCPTCAADLEKALKRMKGVHKAAVTFATAALNIVYDEAVVSQGDIDRAVTSFGVTVASRL